MGAIRHLRCPCSTCVFGDSVGPIGHVWPLPSACLPRTTPGLRLENVLHGRLVSPPLSLTRPSSCDRVLCMCLSGGSEYRGRRMYPMRGDPVVHPPLPHIDVSATRPHFVTTRSDLPLLAPDIEDGCALWESGGRLPCFVGNECFPRLAQRCHYRPSSDLPALPDVGGPDSTSGLVTMSPRGHGSLSASAQKPILRRPRRTCPRGNQPAPREADGKAWSSAPVSTD